MSGTAREVAGELHSVYGLRVLAVRTVVVLTVSSVVITVFAVFNDVTRPYAAAWFMPGLAIAAAALAAMTVLPPRRAPGVSLR